jgi:potassium efflux system protein
MEHLESVLRHPLLKLKGGEITLGSLLIALVVLAIAAFVARLTSEGVRRLFHSRGLTQGAQFAIAKIVRYAVLIVGLAVAVSAAGFDLTALLAASTVLLVGIGFGLQNIAQNFISGIIVLVEQPIRRGDFIKVGEAYGVVDDIGLRATQVITRDQVTIIVPNSELIGSQVINHSKPTLNLRIGVTVGVAYGSDIELVKQALLGIAGAHPHVLKDPAAEVRFEEFGDSSLDFALLVWITNPGEDRRISSELRFAIEAAFRAARIEIPFPQRDVHVYSARQPDDPSPASAR